MISGTWKVLALLAGDYYIPRTSIADGSNERLRQATGHVGEIGVGGGYLYWTEDRRLMRKAL